MDKINEFSDVHAHFQRGPWESVLSEAAHFGLKRVVCAATSPNDFSSVRAVGQACGPVEVFTAYGVHPWSASETAAHMSDEWEKELEKFLRTESKRVSGVGEIGLDFALRGLDERGRAVQRDFFMRQLAVADRLARATTIHAVGCNEEMVETVRKYKNIPLILMHGWNASADALRRLEVGNVYFSFSPRDVKRAHPAIAAAPAERILLESDYPSFSPTSILALAENIAAIRRTPIERFVEQTAANEREFFSKW